jgi:hypothetical protein
MATQNDITSATGFFLLPKSLRAIFFKLTTTNYAAFCNSNCFHNGQYVTTTITISKL